MQLMQLITLSAVLLGLASLAGWAGDGDAGRVSAIRSQDSIRPEQGFKMFDRQLAADCC